MSGLALPTAPRYINPLAGPSKGKQRDLEENDEEADKPSRPPQRVTVGVPEITAVQGLVPTLQWVLILFHGVLGMYGVSGFGVSGGRGKVEGGGDRCLLQPSVC